MELNSGRLVVLLHLLLHYSFYFSSDLTRTTGTRLSANSAAFSVSTNEFVDSLSARCQPLLQEQLGYGGRLVPLEVKMQDPLFLARTVNHLRHFAISIL